jgi:hypothetical protein
VPRWAAVRCGRRPGEQRSQLNSPRQCADAAVGAALTGEWPPLAGRRGHRGGRRSFSAGLLVALGNTGVDPRGQLAGPASARRAGVPGGRRVLTRPGSTAVIVSGVSVVAFAGMSSAVFAASAGQSRRLPRAVQQIQGSAGPAPGQRSLGKGKVQRGRCCAPDGSRPVPAPNSTKLRGPRDSFRGRAGSSRWRMSPAGSAADYLRLGRCKIYRGWSRHLAVAWVWFLS